MVRSAFWQEQARRFGDLAKSLPPRTLPLGATFHPEGWGLEDVRAFRDLVAGRWLLDHGTSQMVAEFKSIAGLCAVALGEPHNAVAWAAWLDYLRRDAVDFKPGQLAIQHRYREGRPEPAAQVPVNGLLFEPPEVLPEPDPVVVTFELGEIDDVCATSERVCCHFADDARSDELSHVTGVEQGKSTATTVDGPGSVRPDKSRALTLKEAAKWLGVSTTTLHRMRVRQEIAMFPATGKPGSHWRVLASEVVRLREQPKRIDRGPVATQTIPNHRKPRQN